MKTCIMLVCVVSLGMSLCAGVSASAAVMFIFGRVIIGLFIEDTAEAEAAIEIAMEFLRIMAGALPILYVLHVVRSALQGMGDTVMPMVSGLAECVMRTGSAIALPPLIGGSGVFWAEVLAWVGADVILIPSYFRRMAKIDPGAGR